MALKINSNGTIDGTDPNNFNNQALAEMETRKRLLNFAREQGQHLEKDMLMIFAKYDKLMRNCKNDKERSDMRKVAAAEVLGLLGSGNYVIDGERFSK